jgi:hypothetical protein
MKLHVQNYLMMNVVMYTLGKVCREGHLLGSCNEILKICVKNFHAVSYANDVLKANSCNEVVLYRFKYISLKISPNQWTSSVTEPT